VLTAPGRQTPLAGGEELDIELSEDQSSLLSRLEQSDNLYESIEILAALRRTRDLTHQITVRGQRGTLFDLLEEVYEEAGRLQLWAVVRRAAGLLGKVDGDLVLAVGAILLRQKSIQVGRAYSDDSTIAHPIPEHEILQKIVAFGRDDVRDRVLTQELILYLSLLIRAQPDLFSELLTIRVGQLINLLTGQLAQERAQSMDEAYEQLMHLAPSQVQSRLEAVLARRRAIERLPQQLEQLDAHSAAGKLAWKPDTSLERLEVPEDGWFAWRQHRGIIDRRPTRFYADVWNIFKHTPALTIGDHMERRNRMDSAVVLSDMTPGERAFALRIEHLLNKVQAPEYRQLNVEALEVLANFFKQNPSLVLDDALSLDALIGHAVMLSYLSEHPEHDTDYNEHKAQAWDSFYASTPAQVSGAIAAALRHLLTVRATGT
jgi:phosphorylase kinase alpha/beta subunit